jgi:hypothetical protein
MLHKPRLTRLTAILTPTLSLHLATLYILRIFLSYGELMGAHLYLGRTPSTIERDSTNAAYLSSTSDEQLPACTTRPGKEPPARAFCHSANKTTPSLGAACILYSCHAY